jgi:hypothetical protein
MLPGRAASRIEVGAVISTLEGRTELGRLFQRRSLRSA